MRTVYTLAIFNLIFNTGVGGLVESTIPGLPHLNLFRVAIPGSVKINLSLTLSQSQTPRKRSRCIRSQTLLVIIMP